MMHVLQVRPQNVSMYVKTGPQKSISNVVMKRIRAKNHTLWDELVTSPHAQSINLALVVNLGPVVNPTQHALYFKRWTLKNLNPRVKMESIFTSPLSMRFNKTHLGLILILLAKRFWTLFQAGSTLGDGCAACDTQWSDPQSLMQKDGRSIPTAEN